MANKMTGEQTKVMCEGAQALGFRPERLLLLDQRLTEWSKNGLTPSIVVKILRHGKTAFEGAYGIAGPDKEPDSLTTDAIFPVCSLTKPVVAVLLSILQEEGLVALCDPVRDYIPEFTGDANGWIRIWHLLTHTSGFTDESFHKHFEEYVTKTLGLVLPREDEPEEAWDTLMIKVRENMGLPAMQPGREMRHNTHMAVCLAGTPANPPQKFMSYCNTGYQLAADIITRVSGKRMNDIAREKVFNPLKMDDTHFLFPREKLPRFVTRGKEFIGSEWLNGNLDSESGSGGLKSTVHDFTRFGQMLLNKGQLDNVRVLSQASVREILADHNSKVPQAEYKGEMFDSTWGLGWNIRGRKTDDAGMLRSSRAFNHGGFGCVVLMGDPEFDISAAYFTVCMTDAYTNMSRFYNMVFGALDGN